MTRPMNRQMVDQLVVEHLPAGLRFAQRLVGDPDTAEEVVQESLCRVLRQWKTYRGKAEFRTWMMQIVVNVVRDRRRRRRETGELPADILDSVASEPGDQVVAAELSEKIRSVIDTLPDRQREVAVLRFGEELEANEIADILQITEANVHTCVHLVRKRIAKAIGATYVERK